MRKKCIKEEMLLEMTGDINIVTKRNGRVVSRDKIDRKLILKMLLNVIRLAADRRDVLRF